MERPMTMTANVQGPRALGLSRHDAVPSNTRIIGVGSAVAGECYTQQELLDLFEISDPRVRSLFSNSAIRGRYLTVPPRTAAGTFVDEQQGALLQKHKRLAVAMGARALRASLADAGLSVSTIDYLCCVSSTGFLTPGLTALLI